MWELYLELRIDNNKLTIISQELQVDNFKLQIIDQIINSELLVVNYN